jgi:hypothetical protein
MSNTLKFEHVKQVQRAFKIGGIMSARDVCDTILDLHDGDTSNVPLDYRINLICQWRDTTPDKSLPACRHSQVRKYFGLSYPETDNII